MPQQFLNGPQITPVTQQMCGKGMPQGMRCNMPWQAKFMAQSLHQPLCRPWSEGFAPIADEQGTVVTDIEGTCGQIILYCLRNSW
jgi:hypothetical protein